jgi:hypothetical protein
MYRTFGWLFGPEDEWPLRRDVAKTNDETLQSKGGQAPLDGQPLTRRASLRPY